MSLIIDEHRQYLRDAVRLAAFEQALAAVVRPGHVVLDLASGSGIMGLLACRAGAKRVYSIEMGGMIGVARDVARANGFGDRFVFIKGHSTRVDLPEKVDVVVADQIGYFGFNAGIIGIFADARRRFLKPEGVTMPLRMSLMLAPVVAPSSFDEIDFWNSMPAGFNFGCVRTLAANTIYRVNLPRGSVCGDSVAIASVDLNQAKRNPFHGEATASIHRSGIIHGLGGWFAAELVSGISVTNSPLDPGSIQRSQVFLPIDHPVEVAEGDSVRIRLTVRPTESVVNWIVDVVGGRSHASKGSFRHSTWKAMLVTSEELQRTGQRFTPILNARGQGRRTVLNLCDGVRELADIEHEVLRLHPGLFETREDAAAFVAEIVTQCIE